MTTPAQASGEGATGDQGIEIDERSIGPWTVRKNPKSDIWIVSKPNHPTQLLRRSHAAACIARDRENETWRKNNIKDAAPDMLAALRAVVSVADRKTVEFDMARNAIAKAEGRRSPYTTPQSDGR